ncbi:acyl-ACP--UDP-N-acetylglucosamine O-acyltransferase [Rubritalea profundi]|uniref:Acyl-[acyl-carrier-protein]--UDP-N-acetylglucosamine O-acyltransferase n=1 Tax=Rubritalea profundi TaxID=1658618 RepID=A0A2S7U2D6_9BACT|nr:acyl-ACP--UDP-N-acetylglucosamine O-acyltransferase [Rubritalea profundi]PQJ29158.1 acyl-[acyl-carrier-protein]--UDP-N-acetylglucosamine O-acyltransferase [Rubritalea profundi]
MIHPTAIIHPDATIGSNLSIGAFTIIDADVTLGDDCTIDPHVWISGHTTLGKKNFVGFGSHIGGNPQDTTFDKSINSGVIIGENNTIREHVTIHRSTSEGGFTAVGDNNMLMINSHLAHDVQVGDSNNLANNLLVAGHVQIGSFCFLGGGAGFHQFLKIGDYSFCQGNASISKDIPPYCMVHSQNQLVGLNVIGLRRAGFNAEQRKEIKSAYSLLFKSGMSMTDALAEADRRTWEEHTLLLINAAKYPSRKGIMMT